MNVFEWLKVLLLGVVEGITEWLPISSTGHMILIEELVHLNVSADFMEMFRVVIQLGAILAVVVLYFGKLWPFTAPKNGWIKRKPGHCGSRFWLQFFRQRLLEFLLMIRLMPCSIIIRQWQLL